MASNSDQPKFSTKYNITHLDSNGTYVAGPIQDDEMLTFFGIVKTLRPQTILEFGFWDGASAKNWLTASDDDTMVYSVEIDSNRKEIGDRLERLYPGRFKFILKEQTKIIPADYDDKIIDLMFIDASHNFELNKITFENNISNLREEGLILVHDTGRHISSPGPSLPANVSESKPPEKWKTFYLPRDVQRNGIHTPGERLFVDWVKTLDKYEVISFETNRIYRHGFTMIQKKHLLPNGPRDNWTI